MPEPWLNVLDFGADGLAIQAAIDSTQATGGGSIIIPSGTYFSNKPIEIKHDNVTCSAWVRVQLFRTWGTDPPYRSRASAVVPM
jgi:hypothetical protein